MCSTDMKGLRFPNTQESCFEAWKRSYKGYSALLCGRFNDSQESRFRLRMSSMGSAALEGGRSDDIHIFCFQAEKRANMDCVEVQGGQFDDSQEWHFQVRNFQIRAAPSSKGTICSSSGKAFSRCETLIMECAVQQWN